MRILLQCSFIIYRVPSHQKLALRRSSQHGPHAICPIIANKLCNIAARLSALTCVKISYRISRRLQNFSHYFQLLGKSKKRDRALLYGTCQRETFYLILPAKLELYTKSVVNIEIKLSLLSLTLYGIIIL